jgi:hypothetical protein
MSILLDFTEDGEDYTSPGEFQTIVTRAQQAVGMAESYDISIEFIELPSIIPQEGVQN